MIWITNTYTLDEQQLEREKERYLQIVDREQHHKL